MTVRLHPALGLLLRQRIAGRLAALGETLLAPGRRVRTVLGVLLAVAWLGNAVASVVFREPYALEVFRRGASLSLLAYFLWHVVKTAAVRPLTPIDWSPAERSFLLTGPFSRVELLWYRVAQTMPGTVFKAVCVSAFFLPEIRVWWAGLLGAVLGFAFLELLRLGVAIVVCGVSSRTFRTFRVAVLGSVGVAGAVAFVRTLSAADTMEGPIAAWNVLSGFGRELAGFHETWWGGVLHAPFRVFAEIVAAERVSVGLLGWMALAAAMCGAAAVVLHGLTLRMGDDEAAFRPMEGERRARGRSRSAAVPRLWGAGPIVWRQLLLARRYGQGVVMALLPPIGLAAAPLLLDLDPLSSFANVVASAAFFSFLLLPSALKFDFRLDFERLHVLKSLPLPPRAVAAGQITVPVVITVGYQALVVGLAAVARPVPPAYVISAVLLLAPATVIVYALENALFLLAPHRPRQDGFEVLLKGLLTFTAKSLLFGLALTLVLAWVEWSVQLCDGLAAAGLAVSRRAVFAAGLGGLELAAAAVAVAVLARTFARCEAVPQGE